VASPGAPPNTCLPAAFAGGLSLPSRQSEVRMLPAGAKPMARRLEMVRSPGEKKLHARFAIGAPESEIDSIGTLGVNDPDEPQIEAVPPAPVPAVIGDRVACKPESVIHLAGQRTLRLRRSRHRAHGVFIPKMRMGTLRPRVAFGPPSDRRRVIPFGSRTGRRQNPGEGGSRAYTA